VLWTWDDLASDNVWWLQESSHTIGKPGFAVRPQIPVTYAHRAQR